MAKLKNLTTTNLTEVKLRVFRLPDGTFEKADLRVEGNVIDDAGELVTTSYIVWDVADLNTQLKQKLNTLCKHVSQDFNLAEVDEDVDTWEDI